MSTNTQPTPSKNSLTITLTEPVVILRTVEVAGVRSSSGDGNFPPSVLRGLLALDLVKASRISSIEVELQATTHAAWSEGLGTSETRKIFSATQEFFRAASSPANRRALSVDPGVSQYSNESEQTLPSFTALPPPFPGTEPALSTPPGDAADEAGQRGRMRVRRRSSADNLVFQRDPVLNRRPALSSPLAIPSTTAEEEGAADTPTSSQFVQSPTSSSSSLETPAPIRLEPLRRVEHSRTASLGSRSSSRTTSPTAETPAKKSHRSHASLIGSIFGRGAQPDSPLHDESRSDSPQSKRGREKNNTKQNCFISYHVAKVSEAFGLDEGHKEVGDGWQEFRKGTYTFPISFEIPSHMPASLECDGGSVTWKLVAKVRRPGVFKSKLTATRDVIVASIPAESDVQTTGDVLIEKLWDDQLQYLFKISGKVLTIGSSFNVQMSFLPLAKVKIFKLAIDLEERVDSYVGGMNMTRTVTSAHNLLNLQCDDESQPLLPLNQDDPLAYEHSPLATLRHQGNPSDVVSQLLGLGPWPIRANLHLPADCKVLHPTSRSRESTIHVTHVLRFTMRLTRGDGPVDPRTNKRKLFEVVVRTPVYILSCWARAEYSDLPRYSETLEGTTQAPQICPCVVERERRTIEGNTPLVGPWSSTPPQQFGGVPNDVLERTLAYERLISGHESVLGDAPPAYEPGPLRAALVSG